MLPIMLPFFVIHCHDASIDAFPLSSKKTSKVILELRQNLCQELFCRGKVELNKCKKSSLGRVNVSLVAVLQWKVREAMSAILLLMLVMEWEMSSDASFTCMRIMAKACVSRPAMAWGNGMCLVCLSMILWGCCCTTQLHGYVAGLLGA